MKRITQMMVGVLMLTFAQTQAQTELNEVNVTNGYKYEQVRYYYYPNLQAYFDTKVAMYLYIEDGRWVESETLAPTSRGYSLKNGQYVMIKDYLGDEPYDYFEQHKQMYPADYRSRPQKPVASEASFVTHSKTLASN